MRLGTRRPIRIIPALVLSVLAIAGCTAGRAKRDPSQILTDATQALAAARAVSYDFTYEGSGSMAGRFSGDVRMLKGETPAETRLRVAMGVPAVHGDSADTHMLEIVLSGGDR